MGEGKKKNLVIEDMKGMMEHCYLWHSSSRNLEHPDLKQWKGEVCLNTYKEQPKCVPLQGHCDQILTQGNDLGSSILSDH